MADITYKRTFQHEDWIDNEDVVQAGGEKGFNTKFHALEAEFDKLSNVIAQINADLVIAPPTTTLAFGPDFFHESSTSLPAWALGTSFAQLGADKTSASGWIPLQLPDGLKIETITVFGEKTFTDGGKVFSVELISVPFNAPSSISILASINLLLNPPGRFKVSASVPDSKNVINNIEDRYLIDATVVEAPSVGAAAPLLLFGFQIICSRL